MWVAHMPTAPRVSTLVPFISSHNLSDSLSRFTHTRCMHHSTVQIVVAVYNHTLHIEYAQTREYSNISPDMFAGFTLRVNSLEELVGQERCTPYIIPLHTARCIVLLIRVLWWYSRRGSVQYLYLHVRQPLSWLVITTNSMNPFKNTAISFGTLRSMSTYLVIAITPPAQPHT